MPATSYSREGRRERGDSTLRTLALALAIPLTAFPLAQAAPEPSWAQWRGPRRSGVSDETGLLAAWPEGGPRRLWTAEKIGRGYSSPIVVGDSIYITGDQDEKLVIIALDLDGSERWRKVNGAYWKNPYPGSRSAVTWAGGRLFHMNAHGRLVCLDPEDGREVWAVDVLERFGARNIIWGRSEAVLVDGGRVLVTAAGTKALMAALDARSGETIWSSPPIEGEKAAYASPILVRRGDRRLLVGSGSKHSFAVDAKSGELVWKHRHPVPENVVGSTPVLARDAILITNSSREHSALYCLRLAAEGDLEGLAWSADVKSGQAGMIQVEGRIYAADGNQRESKLSGIDVASGEVIPLGRGLDFGAAIHADGRIYHLGQRGEMSLLAPSESGTEVEVTGRFQFVEARKRDAWAHPVVCRGRLYLRYHDTLHCFDVRSPSRN